VQNGKVPAAKLVSALQKLHEQKPIMMGTPAGDWAADAGAI